MCLGQLALKLGFAYFNPLTKISITMPILSDHLISGLITGRTRDCMMQATFSSDHHQFTVLSDFLTFNIERFLCDLRRKLSTAKYKLLRSII
jgi:hypothetical protein